MSAELTPIQRAILGALDHRAKAGRHLHHSACIHNLPPEKQVAARGRTVDWWEAMIGPLPKQITPDQWECEPPADVIEATEQAVAAIQSEPTP